MKNKLTIRLIHSNDWKKKYTNEIFHVERCNFFFFIIHIDLSHEIT